MSRWRDVKKGKNRDILDDAQQTDTGSARYPQRIKAFIVDLFMIYMPILYIMTYLVMGGKDDFQASAYGPFLAWLIYGIIYSIFLAKTGQTPGKKAYEIQVINSDSTKLSFIKAFIRYIFFLFSAAIVVGVLTPLFRKDRKALHDIVLQTKVIDITQEQKL